jgi:hypothetical protein
MGGAFAIKYWLRLVPVGLGDGRFGDCQVESRQGGLGVKRERGYGIPRGRFGPVAGVPQREPSG